jgi:AmiR/NasT family two-component response regulator
VADSDDATGVNDPFLPPLEAVGDAAPAATTTAPTSRRRVVVAEDEALIRLDLKETLEAEGYEVVGAVGRGDEAVELVKELHPDLAILDIKMPGMDGITAARQITSSRRAAVLILTAFSQRDLIDQARDAGAFSYLVKPFQTSDLVPAIEVALGRFADMRAKEVEVEDTKERLETQRVVGRAKGLLMDRDGMSEADAFSFIQRTAMQHRAKMRTVAQQIIDGTLPTSD